MNAEAVAWAVGDKEAADLCAEKWVEAAQLEGSNNAKLKVQMARERGHARGLQRANEEVRQAASKFLVPIKQKSTGR